MPTTIEVPSVLRRLTTGTATYATAAATVRDALQELVANFPALRAHLLDEAGNVRSYVRVFVGPVDSETLQGDKTRLSMGSVVRIVPAIAGGVH
jgi:molybdopterin synthase sulfur carrier subunit/adenylyltransferase/sulfurtransferase